MQIGCFVHFVSLEIEFSKLNFLTRVGQTNERTKKNIEKSRPSKNPISQRYVVETITMTTVTERRVLHEETNTTNSIIIAPTAAPVQTTDKSDDVQKTTITAGNEPRNTYLNSDISLKPTSISAQITGILKGGKLWKNETVR